MWPKSVFFLSHKIFFLLFFRISIIHGNSSIKKLQNKIIVFYSSFYYTIFDPFFILFRKMLPKISHFYFPRFLLNEKISFRNRRGFFLLSFPRISICFEEFLPSKCVEFWSLMQRWVECWLCSGSNLTKFTDLVSIYFFSPNSLAIFF